MTGQSPNTNPEKKMTTNTSGIMPVDLRVLVLPDAPKEKTVGGIILPDQHRDREKFAAVKATVIAVGDNACNEWGSAALKPEAGSRVLIAQYAGLNQTGVDGKDYRVIDDKDVVAILKEEA